MTLILAASLAVAPPAVCSTEMTPAALVCHALEASKAGNHEVAAKGFEALAAVGKTEVEQARAWAAAGNLWIAANQPGKAALALDRALSGTGLRADQRGEALLDRARAAEAQNDLKTARAKVTEAEAIIADNSFLWYFSAALAIREGDKARAQAAINRALTLAPTDASIQFEAGHVAEFHGDTAKARQHWSEAQRLDPEGAVGKAAAQALVMLSEPAATGQGQEGR